MVNRADMHIFEGLKERYKFNPQWILFSTIGLKTMACVNFTQLQPFTNFGKRYE
jgi:hypothetical protein